ncbi:hypothetical protein PS903_01779 [Pseudomonas fluorescens]|nr:hypothetical protein PS903_01779 [Pseudomonas fluorescens]
MEVITPLQPSECAGMEDIRREIDALDQTVIKLLGKRFQYVLAASKFKTSATSVRAPERFKAMLATRREWAEAEGLSPDAIEKMYSDLVNHFIAEEMKHWAAQHTASAMLPQESPPPAITFDKPIPILRMFDETKAREFYLDFLGFSVEFEHRFEADLPLYLGIARDGLQLHLSEHHGDASPGSTVFVPMHNIERLRDELLAKRYGYGRPDIVQQGWGQVLEVHDPFGNRIRFCQS